MKKIMVLLLATTMLFASIGCSNGNGGSGENGGSGSVVTKDDYLGTWTGIMEGIVVSITLNADGTVSAYNSGEGKTTGLWTVTFSYFTMCLNGPEESFYGELQNGNLVVNYMGQYISLTKE